MPYAPTATDFYAPTHERPIAWRKPALAIHLQWTGRIMSDRNCLRYIPQRANIHA